MKTGAGFFCGIGNRRARTRLSLRYNLINGECISTLHFLWTYFIKMMLISSYSVLYD